MNGNHENPTQFVLEATAVAQELDKWIRRFKSDERSAAALKAQESYTDLLKRRPSLGPLSLVQSAAVDTLLDGIEARLKFLR